MDINLESYDSAVNLAELPPIFRDISLRNKEVEAVGFLINPNLKTQHKYSNGKKVDLQDNDDLHKYLFLKMVKLIKQYKKFCLKGCKKEPIVCMFFEYSKAPIPKLHIHGIMYMPNISYGYYTDKFKKLVKTIGWSDCRKVHSYENYIKYICKDFKKSPHRPLYL